ncbi:MAG: vitamin K epoxide reductase, partial [Prevotella sp.]|nr:vitamin K epoxide reductase [Prevotella sp.]
MNNINALLHPQTNVEEMVIWVIRNLNIKVSKRNLFEMLKNHPHFPSLLAIRDVLESFGIDSCALNIKDLHVLPSEARNFLVQIKTEQEEELFAYVFGWTEEYIEWLNPQKHKRERIKHDDFATLFTGYVMLFEALDNAGEKDYKSTHRKELQQRVIEYALILFVPALAILSISLHISENGIIFWQRYLHALFLLAGCAIGGLLLLHDYNE